MSTVLVPALVRGCLDTHGLNHRPILLALDTDVDLAGADARQWLVITPDHISIVEEIAGIAGQTHVPTGEAGLQEHTPDSAPSDFHSATTVALRSVATASVTGARTHTGLGSGILQLKIDDQWIDWLRFSNAMATRFHKVSRMIERYCEADYDADMLAMPSGDEARLDPHRCPKCSLRLNTAAESCPRCVPKGQIARRVVDLLRPLLAWQRYVVRTDGRWRLRGIDSTATATDDGRSNPDHTH